MCAPDFISRIVNVVKVSFALIHIENERTHTHTRARACGKNTFSLKLFLFIFLYFCFIYIGYCMYHSNILPTLSLFYSLVHVYVRHSHLVLVGQLQTKIDEYTRISTPRSEMLFKKGYLMRKMKFIDSISAMPSALPKSSSSPSDSASGSVVSNEETASCYSIQSLSPANGSDTTSATYPNDIYDPDMSLYYSSGYYDNNGYFYVNRTYSNALSTPSFLQLFLSRGLAVIGSKNSFSNDSMIILLRSLCLQ